MPALRAKTASSDLAYFDVPADPDTGRTPALFIQGLGADHAAWTAQVSHFGDRRTISYDARGLGESSGTLPFAMGDLASDALAVLDAAGVGKADVVGLSLGGATAMHLALAAPQRIRRLVLAATTAAPDGRQRVQIGANKRLYRAVPPEVFFQHAYANLFTYRYFERRGAFDAALRYAVSHQPPHDVWEAQCDAMLGHDVRDRLGEIRVPVLVVHGLEDNSVHVDRARELARAIPGAQLVELPNVGHSVNLEGMAAFNRAVRHFLDDAT